MTKISALPAAVVANDTDQLETNQAGTSRSITIGQVKAAAVAAVPGHVFAATFGCSPSASGATNTAAIQQALNIGGEIELPAGVINLSNVKLVPRSHSNIYGNGNGTILTRTGSDGTSYLNPFFDIIDVTDVYFEGIIFNFTISTSREYCFHLRASTLASTQRIYVNKCVCNTAGMYIERFVDGVRVENCWFNGGATVGGAGGGIAGIGIGGLQGVNTDGVVRNIVIRGNYFTKYRTEAIDINWNTYDVTIANNIFLDNNLNGGNQDIDVGGGTSDFCHYVTITGNTMIQNQVVPGTHSGITIKLSSTHVTVTGNTMRSATVSSGSAGVTLSTSVRNVTVSGNTIEGFQTGISCITAASELALVGNTIREPALDGISINATTNATISDNTIVGTVFTRGVRLVAATDFTIANNRISGGTTDCILTDAASSGGTISGNTVSNSAQTGIRVLSPSTSITGNVAHNNGRAGFVLNAQHLTVISNEAYNNSQLLADQYGFSFSAASDFAVFNNNKSYDTQATKTQNGVFFNGASDRLIMNGNIFFPVKTNAVTGAASLTNSLNGTAGNIVA